MAADFGNLLNNEMNEFKIQKSSLNQAASDVSAKSDKLDMLNQLHKLETKNVEGKLLVSDAKDLLQMFTSNKVPDFKPKVSNLIITLQNSILDAVMNELLMILDTELGGDTGYDFSFLTQLVSRLEKVARDSNKPENLTLLKNILSKHSNSITDNALKVKIQETLRGINQLDAMTKGETEDFPTQSKLTPTDVAKSSNIDVLGASNKMQIPGLDGIDDMVFDEKTNATSMLFNVPNAFA